MDSKRLQVPNDLKRAVSSGRTVVIIGDLWEDSGENKGGRNGGLESLKRALLETAGVPEAITDPSIGLAEAHRAAARNIPGSTAAQLKKYLHLDQKSTAAYQRIILGPWERVYDLTGIDSALALKEIRNSKGPRVRFTDATQEFEIEHDITQVIHMCGLVSAPENMDFAVPTGAGTSTRDLWFRQLSADLVSRPILVIANHAHPELWTFLRPRANDKQIDITPGFYLSGVVSGADQLRAKNCELTAVSLDVSRTAETFLSPSTVEISDGYRALARIRGNSGANVGARLVSRLLRDSQEPSWDFLRGHDPSWADVAAGRLVRLSRTRSMHNNLTLEAHKRNVVVMKGRAGSGKTALLMRLAYELEGKGYSLVWVDRSAGRGLASIISQIHELSPDAVFVDDLDIFGDTSGEFVRRLNRGGNTLVVASVRTTRIWSLEPIGNINLVDGDAQLTDNDLKSLVDKLTAAGLLGELTSFRPESSRIDRLRTLSQRDLLAALIQVVTGQPFEDRVMSEFNQLSSVAQDVYAFVCFGAARVYEMTHLPEADLLQMIASAPPYSALRAPIKVLVDSKLLLREAAGLRVRHRAIADTVVRFLPKSKVGEIVRSMLRFYAGRAANLRDQSHPDRRQMIHLLSHSHMRELNLDRSTVRSIYEDVQPLLSNDFHYWLQRGAYEVEHGDLDLADSYLESARGCEGGTRDYKVTTEWGFMRLRKAISSPTDQNVHVRAKAALQALEQVARREGRMSPHTFTIIVRQGVRWLETSALLSDAERARIALLIEEIRELGLRMCSNNREFSRAEREMRQRLMVLTGEASATPRFPLP
jgi:KaiC/GvpD/RAD55 family RecA-like ATPase